MPLKKAPPGGPTEKANIATALQAGARYEDLPMSSPEQLPSLVTRQLPEAAMAARGLPLGSNNPYHEFVAQSGSVSPFEPRAARQQSASPPARGAPRPVERASSGKSPSPPDQVPAAEDLASPATRERSRSVPAPSHRKSAHQAQDMYNGAQPPQYKRQESPRGSHRHTLGKSCPDTCTKCGKQRTESLDEMRAKGVRLFPSGRVVSAPAPPSQPPAPEQPVPQRGASPVLNAPRPVPPAHLRSTENMSRSSPPLIASPDLKGPSTPPRGGHHHQHGCGKCGKPRRPDSHSTQSRLNPVASPPLVSTNFSRPSTARAMVLGGFHPSRQSSSTLGPAFAAANNNDDTPLIAKNPSEFATMRQKSTRSSYTRRPAQPTAHKSAPSSSGSLFRRLSNALRGPLGPIEDAPAPALPTATIPAQEQQPPAEQHSTSRPPHHRATSSVYLAVPKTEGPDRPGSPFSFVDTAVEDEVELTQMKPQPTPTLDTSPAAIPIIACNDAPYSPTSDIDAYTSQFPSEEKEVLSVAPRAERVQFTNPGTLQPESNNAAPGLRRGNSVLQRAAQGSLRRFKSLKKAPEFWYRNDLDINSAPYADGEDREAIGVY